VHARLRPQVFAAGQQQDHSDENERSPQTNHSLTSVEPAADAAAPRTILACRHSPLGAWTRRNRQLSLRAMFTDEASIGSEN
jgi:hypothetical protein